MRGEALGGEFERQLVERLQLRSIASPSVISVDRRACVPATRVRRGFASPASSGIQRARASA